MKHLLLSLLFLFIPLSASAQEFDAGKAGFSVRIDGLKSPYKLLVISVLPNRKVNLKSTNSIIVTAVEGNVAHKDKNHWSWKAPQKPGLYPLTITNTQQQSMTINAFVLHPASQVKNEKLGNYRIGNYPEEALKGLESYLPPEGFIEVTEQNQNTRVSPHFTLGQFLCKQASGWPKFVVLRSETLIKLEAVLAKLNHKGHPANSFHIMSGYRTPYYNHSIGNRKYSRHVYGGAADIFVDENPKDGMMDDLNHDGKIDRKDAAVIYDLVERMSTHKGWTHIGGLGEYSKNEFRGPFVHIDARGYRARWGR